MAFEYTDGALATPLVRAVINNDQTAVQEALSRGFNANLPDNRGWTPIHVAAIDDTRIECLKLLLSHPSACINSQTFQGETALFLACQSESAQAVKLLLNQPKCEINLCNSEGASPLHMACSKVNIEIIKLLINNGANIDSQDFNGYTPLHDIFASANIRNRTDQATHIVFYLLKHHANLNLPESEGNYPFHFACQSGILKFVKMLLTASKDRNIINCSNTDGRTPLMMAIATQNVDLLKYLLTKGANPNVSDNCCVIPLHLAAHLGNFEIFSLIHQATSEEYIMKYCTFDEERDFRRMLLTKRTNSLICLTIDTEDLQFLNSVLECGINPAVLQCPEIHSENYAEKTFTLHTPISFLLESKMYDLGERTTDFLSTLISHGSPLKMNSKNIFINFVDPICAALVALNDCPVELVMKCLQILLKCGVDPDLPYGRMPFAMEQACMRNCKEAVLLLLQYSSVLEPEDILRWIEQETSSDQEQIVEALLPLAPYFKPGKGLLPDVDVSRRMNLLAPRVYPLSSYCRTVIRKHLHEESKNTQHLFKNKLKALGLPKVLYDFISYRLL